MRRSEIILTILRIPVEWTLVVSAFFIARDIRSVTDLIPRVVLPPQNIPNEKLLFFALIGATMFVIVSLVRGMYTLKVGSLRHVEFLDLAKTSLWWFFTFIGAVYLSAGFLYTTEIPRLIVLFSLITFIVLITLVRVGVATVLHLIEKRGIISPIKIALFGTISPDDQAVICADKNARVIPLYDTDESAISHEYSEILLGSGVDAETIHRIISIARVVGVPVSILPGAYGMKYSPTDIDLVGGIPLMMVRRSPMDPLGRLLKRVFDIIASSLTILFLIPLWIIISLMIACIDRASPLYTSIRVGRNGGHFRLYKFRSMRLSADTEKKDLLTKNERSGPLFKITNDPRITPLGRFLRKFHLDELPQLINVLLGDMSLVGPRPHLPDEVSQYRFDDRSVLSLKPGITGMGQVHGRHTNTWEREVELDTFYIEHWSIWLDLKILFRTIWVVLQGKGT